MSGIDDDALRSMLSARADRVSPGAAGDVMRAVRAEVRGPRQGAAFSVLPVLTGRTRAGGAGWAVATMLAVLVLVVVALRPQVVPPTSSGFAPVESAPSASTPATSTPPSREPSSAPSGSPGHISLVAFEVALRDGSLDGHLLLATTTLRQYETARLCPYPACSRLYQLDGIGPLVTEAGPGQPVVPASPAQGSTPLTGTFVVVPYKGSMILVGRTEGSLASPAMPSDATNSHQKRDPGGAIALQAIDGTLDQDAVMTCTPNGDCSPPAITWTYPSPQPGGAGGAMLVTLDSPALGIDPSVRKIPGPLLVRTGTRSRPEVVARYEVGSYITVDMPTTSCHLAAGTNVPACDTVAAQALAALPADLSIASLEVYQGAYCPPGTACPTVEPDRAHVIVRSSNAGDWLVELVHGPGGYLLSATPGPLPSDGATSTPRVCGVLPSGYVSTMTCDAAIAAALEVVPAGTQIASLDFGYGGGCPPWLHCHIGSFEPNTGHVIVRVVEPGRDLWVGVKADAAGVVTAGAPVPFPVASPTASPAP